MEGPLWRSNSKLLVHERKETNTTNADYTVVQNRTPVAITMWTVELFRPGPPHHPPLAALVRRHIFHILGFDEYWDSLNDGLQVNKSSDQ